MLINNLLEKIFILLMSPEGSKFIVPRKQSTRNWKVGTHLLSLKNKAESTNKS